MISGMYCAHKVRLNDGGGRGVYVCVFVFAGKALIVYLWLSSNLLGFTELERLESVRDCN